MRSLAIASALAALSLITRAAAAVQARADNIIVDFAVFRDAHCNEVRNDFLHLTLITDDNIGNFNSGPSCVPFHDQTGNSTDVEAGNPIDVGAVTLNRLRDGCELDVFPDAACQEGPARPVWGQCVWNAAERFRAYSIRCNGELLW